MLLKKQQTLFIFLTYLGYVNVTSAAVFANRTVERTTAESVNSSDLKKNTSVCWADNVAYKNQDIVSGAGPCEQCVCNAPDIVCSMIKCEVKTGCKIIQKANQCCPDYKCDCEYNGKVYDNGAKIETPDTPCHVCYCKGGDIMCTTVGCYEREDCSGKTVPGTCCPKYDHCPPLDPDNPRNRNKPTTANSVTLRNGKHGSQPWLLTTDSAHSADAFDELTTVSDESDYTTEANQMPDKMITMILKRFNDSGPTILNTTTALPLINSSNTVKIFGVNDSSASTPSQNSSVGASAAKEALNTIKVRSSTLTLNTPSLTEIIEARTDSTSSSVIDENYSSSNESSEENKRTSEPMSEIGITKNVSREESKGPNINGVIDPSTENVTMTFSSTSAPMEINTEYSTLTMPVFDTEVISVEGTSAPNASKHLVKDKLIEGATLTIQTTVTQIESETPNLTEDTEQAQVLFVEKGSNLSHILSSTTTMDPESSPMTLSSTFEKRIGNETTASSVDEHIFELGEIHFGAHKNLSLFVDASKLKTAPELLADLTTIDDIELTTFAENEDKLETSTFIVTTEISNETESVNQTAFITTTDFTSTFPNTSDAEIFAKPINNATHENETSWIDVAEIELTNETSSVTENAIESRETKSNMTQAFVFTYVELASTENVTNRVEHAPGTEGNTSPLYEESGFSTMKTSELFDNTTPVVSTASSEVSPFGLGATKNISSTLETTSIGTIMVNHAGLPNVTVTTTPTQQLSSNPIVTTKSSSDVRETSLPHSLTFTEVMSILVVSVNSTPSAYIANDSAQVYSSISSTFFSPNFTTPQPSRPTVSTASNSTILANGSSNQTNSHGYQQTTEEYKIEPLKLINSADSLVLTPDLGYCEHFRNCTINITSVIRPTTSHENISRPENLKTNSQLRSNSSMSAYKILLDGQVKPLTRPPVSTIAPLSWLKRPAPSKNSNITTTAKPVPAASLIVTNSTASTTSKPAPVVATIKTSTVASTTSKSVSAPSPTRNSITTAAARSASSVSDTRVNKTTNSSKSASSESTLPNNLTNSVKANINESASLKNESRQEPAQAKVYDPLMPYPEEYPEEYQTIQNGPAIIITRTTYTRIPDVTYTTVTMATLPTYARVQKAEENFASTLFDRKFGERSYERPDGSFGSDDGSPSSQSYFNIDVKKVDEKPDDDSKTIKNKRKMNHGNDQKFVIVQSEPISKEDEDVHMLDEKDIKIVENFMNKNIKL